MNKLREAMEAEWHSPFGPRDPNCSSRWWIPFDKLVFKRRKWFSNYSNKERAAINRWDKWVWEQAKLRQAKFRAEMLNDPIPW